VNKTIYSLTTMITYKTEQTSFHSHKTVTLLITQLIIADLMLIKHQMHLKVIVTTQIKQAIYSLKK